MTTNQDRDLLQERAQNLPPSLQPDPKVWERVEARLGSQPALGGTIQAAPKLRWPVAALTLLGVAVALLSFNLPREQQVASTSPQDPLVTTKVSGSPSSMEVQLHHLLDVELTDLPPEVRETVIHNLAIISSAREEIRLALEESPDNSLLQSLYLNSYANERTLLKDVEAMARQSQRRTQL